MIMIIIIIIITITRMWQMKTEIIPVVIGALGVIKETFRQTRQRNSRKHQPLGNLKFIFNKL